MTSEQTDNEYRQQRIDNMGRLAEMGYTPFGRAFERTGRLADIRSAFEEGSCVKAAGRLTTIRLMGKSVFADLRDGSDRFQIYIQKSAVGDDAFAAFKLLDVGDHIGVEGELFVTRTEESTVKVATWTLLSKALLPLPEKWHGLKDVEARYRQRYLDLVANPEVRELFNQRIAALAAIRSYLTERGFSEVETPMLQAQAGGAAAKPFVAHYDALGADMFMRIAPELYLKRLLVGGFDKVFELNRSFRNEGLDRTHIPEFTMLEIYEAYTDLGGMKDIVQGLITHVAKTVFGGLEIEVPIRGTQGDDGQELRETLNLATPWREVAYRDLILERMGNDWFEMEIEAARNKATAEGLDIEPDWGMTQVTHEVYEKLIEKTLIQPTFVTRLPAELVPLARACEDDPSCADVFELEIAGQEIAPGYTELNDPLIQRERMEAQGNPDEEFLTALEHGMPPAGGMGIGIDRLMVILSGADAIRDVILFPQLRRRATS